VNLKYFGPNGCCGGRGRVKRGFSIKLIRRTQYEAAVSGGSSVILWAVGCACGWVPECGSMRMRICLFKGHTVESTFTAVASGRVRSFAVWAINHWSGEGTADCWTSQHYIIIYISVECIHYRRRLFSRTSLITTLTFPLYIHNNIQAHLPPPHKSTNYLYGSLTTKTAAQTAIYRGIPQPVPIALVFSDDDTCQRYIDGHY